MIAVVAKDRDDTILSRLNSQIEDSFYIKGEMNYDPKYDKNDIIYITDLGADEEDYEVSE